MTDTIESIRAQLAECQATNGKLRGFVEQYLAENDTTEFGCACHPGEGYICGTCRTFDRQLPLRQALALPNDATALNELIAERTKELTAEVERLKSSQNVSCQIYGHIVGACSECNVHSDDGGASDDVAETNRILASHYFELTAQRDAAMKDAERYIFLAVKEDGDTLFDLLTGAYATKEELDNAIDAAIANCKEQK